MLWYLVVSHVDSSPSSIEWSWGLRSAGLTLILDSRIGYPQDLLVEASLPVAAFGGGGVEVLRGLTSTYVCLQVFAALVTGSKLPHRARAATGGRE